MSKIKEITVDGTASDTDANSDLGLVFSSRHDSYSQHSFKPWFWQAESNHFILRCAMWTIVPNVKTFSYNPNFTWTGWLDGLSKRNQHQDITKKKKGWTGQTVFFFFSLTPVWLDNKRNPSFLLQSPTSSLRCQVSVCVNKHQKYAWTYRQKKEAI